MSTTGDTFPSDSTEPTTAGTATVGEDVATDHEARLREQGVEFPDKPEGPIAAAILAGGVGCLALGVLTTLAEASTAIHDWLELSSDVGPLAGMTVVAVIVWLVAWAVLHAV
ncbi:MAG TPA: hypothetical protein VE575_14920, partial [Acidimicrobiales bacterium]|nr:hypothetical protein [Acidimicrobiales bacterium]